MVTGFFVCVIVSVAGTLQELPDASPMVQMGMSSLENTWKKKQSKQEAEFHHEFSVTPFPKTAAAEKKLEKWHRKYQNLGSLINGPLKSQEKEMAYHELESHISNLSLYMDHLYEVKEGEMIKTYQTQKGGGVTFRSTLVAFYANLTGVLFQSRPIKLACLNGARFNFLIQDDQAPSRSLVNSVKQNHAKLSKLVSSFKTRHGGLSGGWKFTHMDEQLNRVKLAHEYPYGWIHSFDDVYCYPPHHFPDKPKNITCDHSNLIKTQFNPNRKSNCYLEQCKCEGYYCPAHKNMWSQGADQGWDFDDEADVNLCQSYCNGTLIRDTLTQRDVDELHEEVKNLNSAYEEKESDEVDEEGTNEKGDDEPNEKGDEKETKAKGNKVIKDKIELRLVKPHGDKLYIRQYNCSKLSSIEIGRNFLDTKPPCCEPTAEPGLNGYKNLDRFTYGITGKDEVEAWEGLG